MEVPPFKDVRRTYGFDEVAIVPGAVTTNPDQTDVSFALNGHTLSLPVLASAMDAVVSPDFAVNLGRMGGLGVLNLEGVWTRYEDADVVLGEIAETPQDQVTPLLQKVYTAPIREDLVARARSGDQGRRCDLRRCGDAAEHQAPGPRGRRGGRGRAGRPVDRHHGAPHLEQLPRTGLLRACGSRSTFLC